MNNSEFYSAVLECIRTGGGAFVTVLEVSGSSPRDSGAHMLVSPDGKCLGTIGGGALEHRAVGAALDSITQKHSFSLKLELTPESLGMICGGDVRLGFLYLESGNERLEFVFAQMLKCINNAVDCEYVFAETGGVLGLYLPGFDDMPEPDCIYRFNMRATERALIFGAGHIGRELTFILARLGFSVTVLDNREEYLKELPNADKLIRTDYSSIPLNVGARDYIIIITHGHYFDKDVLREALKTSAKYIGMIGSRKKAETTFSELENEGFTKQELSRVHAPVGITLGGKAPAEIAVSIAAQMIQVRHGFRSADVSDK